MTRESAPSAPSQLIPVLWLDVVGIGDEADRNRDRRGEERRANAQPVLGGYAHAVSPAVDRLHAPTHDRPLVVAVFPLATGATPYAGRDR